MRVTFLGVGEAFDENYPNVSVLVQDKCNLLLDCGYSIPPRIWKSFPGPDFLDAIYISHQHADHSFGLSPLLVRMSEDGRKKGIAIIGPGIKRLVKRQFDIGYRGILERLPFRINFIEVENDQKINFGSLELRFASTRHMVPNLAVKVSKGGKSVCYSGDGSLTRNALMMYEGCDLLIHECFSLGHMEKYMHSDLSELSRIVNGHGIKRLALVHINRNVRAKREDVKAIQRAGSGIFLPEPGETIEI